MKQPRASNRRSRPSAFTLTELLVVIAIIMVLIALLVPTLETAQLRVLNVKCISQQRQLGMGVIAYLQDHKMEFPPRYGGCSQCEYGPSGGGSWFWASYLWTGGYVKSPDLFYCPMKPRSMYGSDAFPQTLGAQGVPYGWNCFLTVDGATGQNGYNPKYYWDIKYPASTPMINDNTSYKSFKWVTGAGKSFHPILRHGERFNVLFVDGHVSGMTSNEWQNSPYVNPLNPS